MEDSSHGIDEHLLVIWTLVISFSQTMRKLILPSRPLLFAEHFQSVIDPSLWDVYLCPFESNFERVKFCYYSQSIWWEVNQRPVMMFTCRLSTIERIHHLYAVHHVVHTHTTQRRLTHSVCDCTGTDAHCWCMETHWPLDACRFISLAITHPASLVDQVQFFLPH